MSNSNNTPDVDQLDREIEEKQRELQTLKRKKQESVDAEINTILRRWQYVIDTITPDEQKNGMIELLIYPWVKAGHDHLQSRHYTSFGKGAWDWREYISCSDDSDPLRFRANSIKKLLPVSKDDLKYLINSGVQLELKMPDSGVRTAWTALKQDIERFEKRIKTMDGSTLSFRGTDARQYNSDLRTLNENREEFEKGLPPNPDKEDVKWFREFPQTVVEFIQREADLTESFYGFEENSEAKKLHRKIKRIKKILDSK